VSMILGGSNFELAHSNAASTFQSRNWIRE
jgi:hypothetical protein